MRLGCSTNKGKIGNYNALSSTAPFLFRFHRNQHTPNRKPKTAANSLATRKKYFVNVVLFVGRKGNNYFSVYQTIIFVQSSNKKATCRVCNFVFVGRKDKNYSQYSLGDSNYSIV